MKNKISISTILNYFSFLPSVQNGGSSRGALQRSWGPSPCGGARGLGPMDDGGDRGPGPQLFWVKKKKSQKEEKADKANKTKPPYRLPPPLAQGLD